MRLGIFVPGNIWGINIGIFDIIYDYCKGFFGMSTNVTDYITVLNHIVTQIALHNKYIIDHIVQVYMYIL